MPYEDTWHIFWVNRGMYLTIITLYDWTVVTQSNEAIGINNMLLLLGFMSVGVFLIILKQKYNYRKMT